MSQSKCLVARFCEKAVFGSRVLVRAKSQSSVMVARYGENTAFESRV